MFSISYESVVDSFMYIIVCTLLDIAFNVGKMNMYMLYPGKVHWEAVKWILIYLKLSTWHDLLFDAKAMSAKSLLENVDADHGGDLKKKNQQLYIFSVLQMARLVGNLLFKSAFLCHTRKLNILQQ